MCFNDEEVKFNVVNEMTFSADDENYSVIESLGWDYREEEAYHKLSSIENFFEGEGPSHILEELNIVFSERKFETLDLQTKGEKKTMPSIEEP
ncbi:hypothetical protein E5676_scaffold562G00420 [Cucumis melo var. makuwa]|uniref:Uncharacterized protein n=1 Tax=Cucumis melo var. makuwa TaxID=1194695 RepID=A0A5D3BLQ8_CUCMM|nr:hypothetical protein E5676_scaffold562G00420 [Cucumis melo var. makuwa]